MINAKLPLYVRFGEIPIDGQSAIHLGDVIVGKEVGVSVWDCVEANNCYYPVMPSDVNENGISDYFDMLLNSESNVYLVTGNRLRLEGQDREPLLSDVVVLKDLTKAFRKNKGERKGGE